ncbi:1-deoxy-d-xylulose 5-phosphate reductoisomerase [Cystoisospora suis]|uniref:1-deoxy-D-xylulose 5-phosphate reductoisomerase, apicoplastic n=1 Tax=Cystoisospora suis TaxID=483139 RepID=A0A2C6KL46_9APIC|nr:1-deoxy-d-xylulose 5-phosphate reductoisomerase [Cystoisospora suis]
MHTPLTRHPHSLQDAGQIADLPKPADQRSEVKTGGQPSFLSLRENEECSSTLSLLGEKKRRIVLLGSTGSIGRSTLEVVEEYPERFGVVGLAANGSRLPRLVEQILFFSPRYVVVGEEEKAQRLRELLDHPDTVKKLRVYPEILFGDDGLVELATRIEDYDILVSAIVGFKGVRPTIEALRRGKHVALANKEALVAAGEVFRTVYTQQGFRKTSTAQPAETNALGLYAQDHPNSITEERHTKESPGSKKTNPIKVTKNSYMIKEKPPTPGLLLPIDSEHSAIFQALQGVPSSCYPPRRILLTASGGPFRKKSREDLKNVTLRDALKHPKWSMGAKITIDSATMMNKGLEVIEAHFAFGCPYTSIEVLIHPQAIMHSGIELHDGAVLAQMGVPDMKLPIAYALTWPRRLKTSWPRLDLTREEPLTFEKPDLEKFGCLKLAYEAGRKGGLAPACLNAANEVAVERFRKEEISFLHIEETVRRVLQLYDTTDKSLSSSHGVTLEDVFEADRWARTVAGELKLYVVA